MQVTNMPSNKNELDLICGMFRNESKNGDIYYNGRNQETGEEFVMFKNSYYQEGDNKPYFRLMKKNNSAEKASGSSGKTLED